VWRQLTAVQKCAVGAAKILNKVFSVFVQKGGVQPRHLSTAELKIVTRTTTIRDSLLPKRQFLIRLGIFVSHSQLARDSGRRPGRYMGGSVMSSVVRSSFRPLRWSLG